MAVLSRVSLVSTAIGPTSVTTGRTITVAWIAVSVAVAWIAIAVAWIAIAVAVAVGLWIASIYLGVGRLRTDDNKSCCRCDSQYELLHVFGAPYLPLKVAAMLLATMDRFTPAKKIIYSLGIK